jgi:hypothetical protein
MFEDEGKVYWIGTCSPCFPAGFSYVVVLFNRKLQDDLTDEMVGLAQQLKESSLLMSQSLQNTEKV